MSRIYREHVAVVRLSGNINMNRTHALYDDGIFINVNRGTHTSYSKLL